MVTPDTMMDDGERDSAPLTGPRLTAIITGVLAMIAIVSALWLPMSNTQSQMRDDLRELRAVVQDDGRRIESITKEMARLQQESSSNLKRADELTEQRETLLKQFNEAMQRLATIEAWSLAPSVRRPANPLMPLAPGDK